MVDIIFPYAQEDIPDLALLALGDGVFVDLGVHEVGEDLYGVGDIRGHEDHIELGAGLYDVVDDGVYALAVAGTEAFADDRV